MISKGSPTKNSSLTRQINDFGDSRASIAVSVKKARGKLVNEKAFGSLEEIKEPILDNKF